MRPYKSLKNSPETEEKYKSVEGQYIIEKENMKEASKNSKKQVCFLEKSKKHIIAQYATKESSKPKEKELTCFAKHAIKLYALLFAMANIKQARKKKLNTSN